MLSRLNSLDNPVHSSTQTVVEVYEATRGVFPKCKNIFAESVTKEELFFSIRCISLVTWHTTKLSHGGGRSKTFICECERCPFHLHFVRKQKEEVWTLMEDDPLNSVCMTCNPRFWPKICGKEDFLAYFITEWLRLQCCNLIKKLKIISGF